MRYQMLWIAVVSWFLGVGSAVAHEGETHGAAGAGGSATTRPGAAAGEVQQVTGEVVDLACYLGEGARGAWHRECAEKCITSGLPVGIKTADRLYLVIGGEHGPANSALAPLAAQQVTAEGIVTERDGVHLIAIKKVTPKGA